MENFVRVSSLTSEKRSGLEGAAIGEGEVDAIGARICKPSNLEAKHHKWEKSQRDTQSEGAKGAELRVGSGTETVIL